MKQGGFSPLRIVLAGAAVSAFLFAIAEGVGIYFKISKDVSMWTAGGLIGTSLESTSKSLFRLLQSVYFSLFYSQDNLLFLSLNEETAVGFGQKTIANKNNSIYRYYRCLPVLLLHLSEIWLLLG